MTTLLFTHPACLLHDTGVGHPECVDRLRAVLGSLEADRFRGLVRREAPVAALEDIIRVHPRSYVEGILAEIPAQGLVYLDDDTVVGPHSGEAALRAAGAVVAAVDAVIAEPGCNAFCAVRPPGHHAEPQRAMGFCLFNNIAIGACRARGVHRLERVAIIDFDVHHGNGTQAVVEDDPHLFYASTHQALLYPGTGRRNERGCGNVVNAPLRAGSASADFRHAVTEFILPELNEFRPDLVMISAGFDGHYQDPLAELELTEDDFAWVTAKLKEVAVRHCDGRLVSILEGGYDLAALAAAAAAHVAVLMAA
jgi:acetoin utilization deacetylase AcuC-like enzyme